jgi:signal transduction histidine kinase
MSPRLRILYAEDNALDADLTCVHFSEHAPDFDIQVVESGRACLDRISQTEFDLVLLDHHLPDMEGLDVLRTLVRTGVQVPVVLVTGTGDEELVVKALHLGARSYVPKADNYLETLPDLLRGVVEDHRHKQSQGLLASAPRRVLYVEHHAMDIELTLRHFAETAPHFELDAIRTCSEALERLGRLPAYDALLIDLRMLDQSGLDFVREAQRRRLTLPPFIMISGKGDEAAAIASLRLGAADYVAKRDGYLDDLANHIDRAIAHDRLARLNAQLQAELTERKRAEKERERLEGQLRVAQRLEAIGQLAGGVAHDFNNLLSVILSYTDFAIAALRHDDPLQDDLSSVKQAAVRAANLTRQLLAFGRKQLMEPVVIVLNDVVGGMQSMLRRLIGEDIELRFVLAADLGNIKADPGQLEQVLMNLVVNARDAMLAGGTMTVETANVELDEQFAQNHIGVTPGSYVRLSVTDTGSGMDEETKARLFDPFFTTKDPGRGTGLGLSTVYGIVKQSGGHILVDSEPAKGTRFEIYLPREFSVAKVSSRARADAAHSVGTETILVVEDEEELRRLANRILGRAGYTVLTAADGEEALQICKTHRGAIELLLTDVVMPKMGGRELATRIVVERPAIKVLYTSGYTDDAIAHQGVLDPGVRFVAKPVTPAELTRKVREVLDEE